MMTGMVVQASDTKTTGQVAVKRMKHIFEDLVDCKRILREIAILNRINHPSVVGLVDVIIPGDLSTFDEVLLILELVDNDFKRMIQGTAVLTDSIVKRLMFNTLVGLAFLRSANIVHRDLKPANLLVNQDCTVKICDFGLARSVQSDAAALGSTAHSLANNPLTAHVVTRWYRAPEIILMQQGYSQAIDMWSLGCIFMELLQTLEGNAPIPQRFPLFPGQHSIPLSPRRSQRADWEKDQLVLILKLIGLPSDSSHQAHLTDEGRGHLQVLAQSFNDISVPLPSADTVKERLTALLPSPHTSPEAIDLLASMLKFSPSHRITVEEAIKHPYITSAQAPSNAGRTEGSPISLPFDDSKDMDEMTLRYWFIQEVKKLHPEVQVPAALEKYSGA
eukprot:GHVN01023459.1.p1 GENE.GHVN01023459.1~~GHVN01023459.1.p1  ORF type:complete len:390 (-),score=60.58 GHVN01023459.1:367-1536(-)